MFRLGFMRYLFAILLHVHRQLFEAVLKFVCTFIISCH
jgi:hypothetical protein